MNTEKLRLLLEAATPGPWRIEYQTDVTHYTEEEADQFYREPLFRGSNATSKDANLIVEMRNCLPALLDRLDKLEAVVAAAQRFPVRDELKAALAALEEKV